MFYNPSITLSHDCLLNFVTSERGAGKSYSTLKHCVNDYLKRGNEFIYLRRTAVELDVVEPTMFKALECDNVVIDGAFRVVDHAILHDRKIAGRCIALSTAHQLKSTAFPMVKTIIFDEFLQENNRYLKNEPEKLLSVIETIGRMRDIRVICLGNQHTLFNPYYNYFKLRPKKDSVFTKDYERSILIHQFKSDEYRKAKKETKFGRLIKGTEYGGFMLNNENYADNYEFVDNLKGIKKYPVANIVCSDVKMIVYDCEINNSIGIYICEGNIEALRTYNYDEILREGTTLERVRNGFISSQIARRMRYGSVRFDSPLTRDAVMPFIKIV